MSWINPATGVNSGLSIPHSRPLISKTQIKQGDNTDPSTRPSNHRRDHGNDDQRDPEAQARNRHKEPVQNHQPASHHHGPGLFPALGKPMLRRGWERCGGQIHEACLAGSIPAPSSGKHPTRVARAIAECSQRLALYDNKTAVLHREQDASIGVMEMRTIVAMTIPGPLPQGCRVTHLETEEVVILHECTAYRARRIRSGAINAGHVRKGATLAEAIHGRLRWA